VSYVASQLLRLFPLLPQSSGSVRFGGVATIPGHRNLRERMGRESMEAFGGVLGVIEDLEQAINPGDFEDHTGAGRNRRELEVSILLHDLFHAVQQHLDSRAVQLIHSRKVKYDARPVRSQDRFDFSKKPLDLSSHQSLGHLLHDNWFTCDHETCLSRNM